MMCSQGHRDRRQSHAIATQSMIRVKLWHGTYSWCKNLCSFRIHGAKPQSSQGHCWLPIDQAKSGKRLVIGDPVKEKRNIYVDFSSQDPGRDDLFGAAQIFGPVFRCVGDMKGLSTVVISHTVK